MRRKSTQQNRKRGSYFKGQGSIGRGKWWLWKEMKNGSEGNEKWFDDSLGQTQWRNTHSQEVAVQPLLTHSTTIMSCVCVCVCVWMASFQMFSISLCFFWTPPGWVASWQRTDRSFIKAVLARKQFLSTCHIVLSIGIKDADSGFFPCLATWWLSRENGGPAVVLALCL